MKKFYSIFFKKSQGLGQRPKVLTEGQRPKVLTERQRPKVLTEGQRPHVLCMRNKERENAFEFNRYQIADTGGAAG